MTQTTMNESASRAELRGDISSHFSTCYQAFLSVDINRTGKIEVCEIERILEIYNLPPSHAPGIFKKIDRDGNGVIDYSEFSAEYFGAPSPVKAGVPLQPRTFNEPTAPPLSATSDVTPQKSSDLGNHLRQHYSSARKAFLKLDQDRSGYVSQEELHALEASYNLPMDNVIKSCDKNSDGKLSFNEVAKYLFAL